MENEEITECEDIACYEDISDNETTQESSKDFCERVVSNILDSVSMDLE